MDYQVNEPKKKFTRKLKEFSESLFGPVILLICLIFRTKTGYEKGDKLILTTDHGKFKKGLELEFIKLYDKENPFQGPSLIAVKHNEVMIVLPEHFLKEKSYLKRFLTGYEFNAKMIKGNWRLGKSHPFLLMKVLYSIVIVPIEIVEWVVNKFRSDDENRSR